MDLSINRSQKSGVRSQESELKRSQRSKGGRSGAAQRPGDISAVQLKAGIGNRSKRWHREDTGLIMQQIAAAHALMHHILMSDSWNPESESWILTPDSWILDSIPWLLVGFGRFEAADAIDSNQCARHYEYGNESYSHILKVLLHEPLHRVSVKHCEHAPN